MEWRGALEPGDIAMRKQDAGCTSRYEDLLASVPVVKTIPWLTNTMYSLNKEHSVKNSQAARNVGVCASERCCVPRRSGASPCGYNCCLAESCGAPRGVVIGAAPSLLLLDNRNRAHRSALVSSVHVQAKL